MRARIKSYLVLNDGAMCSIFGGKTIGECLAPSREGEAPAIFDVMPDLERPALTRRRARKRAEHLIIHTLAVAEQLCHGTLLDEHPDAERLISALNKNGTDSFRIVGVRAGQSLTPRAFPIRS
jgi:hypothetical protein